MAHNPLRHARHKIIKHDLSSTIRTLPSASEFHGISRTIGASRGLYRRSGISPCPEELSPQKYYFRQKGKCKNSLFSLFIMDIIKHV